MARPDIGNLGTDDLSLELHLSAFESPNLDLSSIRSNAIVLKFGAFVSGEVESRFRLRKFIDFQPTLSLALQNLKPTKFRSLANLKSKMDEGTFRITVLVDWLAELECQYRYLLACQRDLQAFWRHRIFQNMMRGSIPLDLCVGFPLESEELIVMESVRPAGCVEKKVPRTVRYKPKYIMAPLRATYEFSSSAEAESRLKGTLLYEEHVISEMRKKYLDGKWPYTFREFDSTRTSLAVVRSLLTVSIYPGCYEEDAKPSDIGERGFLTWSNRVGGLYVLEDCTVVSMEYTVIAVPAQNSGVHAEWTVSMVVLQPFGDPTFQFLIAQGWVLSFEFSRQPAYVPVVLEATDGLLFGGPKDDTSLRSVFKSILMGRDNYCPMRRIPIALEDRSFTKLALAGLDADQYKAFEEAVKSMFLIIQGPPGCGKTFLAAKFCNVCLK
ncbi:hypothetical protein IFR05_014717 [Cadophora sp. M221]|nr:hypothetical protein IFR05_014717 [Cadophora sp. M221]